MQSSQLPSRASFLRQGFTALTKEDIHQLDPHKTECPICYGEFDEAEMPVKPTRCGHIFGKDCLKAYLNSKSATGIYQDRCPQCRVVLYRRGFPHNVWAWVDRNQYMLFKYGFVFVTIALFIRMIHNIYRFTQYETSEAYDLWQLWLLFVAVFETHLVVFVMPNFLRQYFPD
jgi:hypothetical protein